MPERAWAVWHFWKKTSSGWQSVVLYAKLKGTIVEPGNH